MSELILKKKQDLPNGWIKTKLGNIANIKSGGTPSTSKKEYWDGDIPWINSGKLKDSMVTEPSKFITKLGLDKSSAKLFSKNTVLVALTGATTAKVGYLTFSASTNQSVTGILSNKNFIPKYIFYILIHEREQILSKKTGTAQHHINQKIVEDTTISFCPIKEQKRIVEKIEELFSLIDKTTDEIKSNQKHLDYYFRSFLKNIFSGNMTKSWRKSNPYSESNNALLRTISSENTGKVKLAIIPKKPKNFTIPPEWKFVLSNDLLTFVTSGSRGWAKYYSEFGSLFLRVTNLDRNSVSLDLTKIKRVKLPSKSEGRRTSVHENDLLISITADIGMVAVAPSNLEEAYVNQHISLARLDPRLNSKFIAWFLASFDGGQQQFQNLQHGVIKSGLGLNDIRSIWIPFPFIDEQKIIVDEIEHHLSILKQNKVMMNLLIRQTHDLKKIILKQAFEGKLIPQDPNDEPAEVLLEKIKQEKEQLKQKEKSTERKKNGR